MVTGHRMVTGYKSADFEGMITGDDRCNSSFMWKELKLNKLIILKEHCIGTEYICYW